MPYANGPVHIGHLAGCYIPADIYVRYLRSNGRDVKFVCGSDEHGVPITIKAKKEGITPQQVVDKYHEMMKKSFLDFGISFDIYSRTSSKTHAETASEFFKTLHDKGVFVEKKTMQYYDESQQQFLADRYIIGTCPKCHNENAYGDQCEKCGSSLSPSELINPRSALSGNPPVMKETTHWFFPLDKYSDQLKEYILKGHPEWKSNVYGQCKSWLESGDGLQPRAMTRDLDWGVPVPLEDAKGKVLYVWFDAPIGYVSATKDLLPDDWEKYWKDPETRLIHFIGKDNIVFHCIIFPAILMAHGGYILPDNVPANEFLNLEGDKISTSRNWAVWLHEYLDEFKGKQDVLRYVLTANAPETKDNDFTWKDFQARNNNELVAILGNFVNRTLVLTKKYYDGKVPSPSEYTEADLHVLKELSAYPDKIAASIEQFRFREALGELMNLARLGNKFLADNEPWKIHPQQEERVKTIMNVALQICTNLAIVCEPFLPRTSYKLFRLLGVQKLDWAHAKATDNIKDGHIIKDVELLFTKIEDAEVEAQVEKLKKSKQVVMEESTEKQSTVQVQKAETSFDEFTKMDIRIGTILEAEKVPNTDKLLKLLIDTGFDKRTVVSGIAGFYDPSNIIGKKVSILVNLAPRKIKGIESRGMILMAEDADGTLSFVSPENEIGNGGVVH